MSKWVLCSFSGCNYRIPLKKAERQDGHWFCTNQCIELARENDELKGEA